MPPIECRRIRPGLRRNQQRVRPQLTGWQKFWEKCTLHKFFLLVCSLAVLLLIVFPFTWVFKDLAFGEKVSMDFANPTLSMCGIILSFGVISFYSENSKEIGKLKTSVGQEIGKLKTSMKLHEQRMKFRMQLHEQRVVQSITQLTDQIALLTAQQARWPGLGWFR